MRVLALALALLVAGAAAAAPKQLRFRGYAYDLKSGQYLYTEVHRQSVEGDRWLGGTITYVAADGKLLGRKTLDFSKHPFVPAYQLDLVQEGYLEAVSPVEGGFELMRRRRSGDAEETAEVPIREPMTSDSGIHMFVRSVFVELLAGRSVPFTIAVPGSLDSFRFRAVKTGETTFEGRPAVAIRLEPATLLRLLAEPLELVYEPDGRKLVEYRGISNVHDPVTGHAYNVRIAYYSKPPSDAPKLPPGF